MLGRGASRSKNAGLSPLLYVLDHRGGDLSVEEKERRGGPPGKKRPEEDKTDKN